jgi:hypothetical protein
MKYPVNAIVDIYIMLSICCLQKDAVFILMRNLFTSTSDVVIVRYLAAAL